MREFFHSRKDIGEFLNFPQDIAHSPAIPLVKNEHSYTQAGNKNLEGAHNVVTKMQLTKLSRIKGTAENPRISVNIV